MEECKNKKELNQLAYDIRLQALDLAFSSGTVGSHLGAGLSTVEIFAALYGNVLKYDIAKPEDDDRDRLIVSKGHCVLSYYSALYKAGFLSKTDLDSFEKKRSVFHGHATRNLNNGIDFSGGSLGLGVSFAAGVAYAIKKKNSNGHVYALIGDGECDEGIVWESCMSASHNELSNYTLIVDKNKLQYDGFTKDILNHFSLTEKFKSFGFDTFEVDGHNCCELVNALSRRSNRPICIIAHTVKGKGVSFMENKKEWHHGVLSFEQYQQAKKEVEENGKN